MNADLIYDYVQPAFEVVGIVVLCSFGYYAIKLLSSFKAGMLEKGWKQVTVGAAVLAVAQIVYIAGGFGSSTFSTILEDAGQLMRFTAVVFVTLGLRTQYQIWRVDNKNAKSNSERVLQN